MYLCYIGLVKVQGRFGWAATTKTDPNDTRRVVWALGMFFFSTLFCNHLLYIYFISILLLVLVGHCDAWQLQVWIFYNFLYLFF